MSNTSGSNFHNIQQLGHNKGVVAALNTVLSWIETNDDFINLDTRLKDLIENEKMIHEVFIRQCREKLKID